MKRYLQAKSINFLIGFLGLPLPKDFLEIRGKGQWFVQGKQLSPENIQKLKEDADLFSKSTIWKLLTDGSREVAYKGGVETSTNFDQVYVAKAVIYLVDTFRTILKNINNN
ncbi:MAG TPA: hypothetical protein ENI13_02000 [candidate division CPR3 bacterium]|uniref:Uncharacterized protein n=1 Tax=candidate division CPR3 bacterium TaxID=2268181 RepID=A0A7C1S9I6_UNCC3|nr:hypothetical protein [candidate division CPR3 bacterium]